MGGAVRPRGALAARHEIDDEEDGERDAEEPRDPEACLARGGRHAQTFCTPHARQKPAFDAPHRRLATFSPHDPVRLRSGVRYGCASQVSSLARMAALTLTQPSRAMCLTWCSS